MSAELRLFEENYKHHAILVTHQFDNNFDSKGFYGTKIAEVRINQNGESPECDYWLFKYTFYRVSDNSCKFDGKIDKGFFIIQRSTYEGVRTISVYSDDKYNRMLSDIYQDIGNNLFGMDLVDLEDALIAYMTDCDLEINKPDDLFDKSEWKYDKYTGELLDNSIS